MPLSQNIFRAYDIRGLYPSELNGKNAELIAKAFASFLVKKLKIKSPKVVVGRDTRTHSPEIQKGFIEGLVESGCQVTDIGVSPTPALYFANTVGKFDAGCNITASHNPKEYNGIKLIREKAHAVYGDDLQTLYKIIRKKDFVRSLGSVMTKDFKPEYKKKLVSLFKVEHPLKVVVDTANGVTGFLYPKILKALGHEIVGLYTESDGTFPNHEPDPIVEKNCTELKKKVIDLKADCGLAFDGDGDRVSLVTEKGVLMNADRTLMLLAKDALSRHPGKAIVFTVSCSQLLFDLIKKWGGKPYMEQVGHSFVEHAMTRLKAILGGEQSGHYFLPEGYYSYDDALVTAGRLLKIVSESKKPVSELFSEFPKTYAAPELRPDCPDNVKFKIIEKTIQHFRGKYPCITLGGIRIDFGHGGWAGIRASNTSPKISVTMEAESPEALEKIKKIVMGYLKQFPEIKW